MVSPVHESWRAEQQSARRAALVIHGAVSQWDTGDDELDERGDALPVGAAGCASEAAAASRQHGCDLDQLLA